VWYSPATEEGRLLCLLLLWLGTMSADAEHKAHRAKRGKIKGAANAKPALSVGHRHRHHCVGIVLIGPKTVVCCTQLRRRPRSSAQLRLSTIWRTQVRSTASDIKPIVGARGLARAPAMHGRTQDQCAELGAALAMLGLMVGLGFRTFQGPS